MKRLILLGLLLGLVLPSLACYHNQIVVSPDYDPAMTAPTHQETRLHVLALIPIGGDIDLNEYCPNGAGVVETKLFFPFIVTFGQMSIYCGNARATLDDELELETAGL